MFLYEPEPLRLGLFDLGGVLYHAHYFALFEQAREAFLRSSGLPYPRLAKAAQHLAVAESHQYFSAPIYYGDTVVVELGASDVKNVSVALHYRILAADARENILHRAETKLVFIEASSTGTLRPARMPDELKRSFETLAG